MIIGKKHKRVIAGILGLIVFFTFTCPSLSAEGAAEGLSDQEVSERIDFIQDALDQGSTAAQRWWYGWIAFYSGATAFSFVVASLTDDRTLKATQTVSGFQSLVGLSGLLIAPFTGAYAAGVLRSTPEDTPPDRGKKLSKAERLLKKSAEREVEGRAWVQHALGILVNVAGALVIWKGYDKQIREAGDEPWREALLSFALGTAVSQLEIWTQPTRAIGDWEEYQKKYAKSGGEAQEDGAHLRLVALPTVHGLIIGTEINF